MRAPRRLLLLTVVAAIALGGLVGSVREGPFTEILQGPEVSSFILTLMSYMILAAALGLTLFMIRYWKIIVEEMKNVFLYSARTRKRRPSSLVVSLVAVVFVYGVLALIFLFRVPPTSTEPTTASITTATSVVTQTAATGGTQGTATTTPTLSLSPDPMFRLAIGLLMVAMISIGSVIIVQSLISARKEALSVEEEMVKAEVVEAIRESVFELESSLSPREAILRCYGRFCELLKRRGVAVADHQTAREFEELAARFLKLPEESLAGLTDLFEEARYSTHEMTSRDREEALRHLRDLEQNLSMKVKAR